MKTTRTKTASCTLRTVGRTRLAVMRHCDPHALLLPSAGHVDQWRARCRPVSRDHQMALCGSIVYYLALCCRLRQSEHMRPAGRSRHLAGSMTYPDESRQIGCMFVWRQACWRCCMLAREKCRGIPLFEPNQDGHINQACGSCVSIAWLTAGTLHEMMSVEKQIAPQLQP